MATQIAVSAAVATLNFCYLGESLSARASISALLIIATVVWAAFLWALGIELTWGHAIPFSLTLTAVTSAWWFFDKHLLKFWLGRWFVRRVYISGTWYVELQSTYKNPETGELVEPIVGYAVVRQTLTTLSIRLMTEQSESYLLANSFDIHDDGTTDIYGVYQSDPIIHRRSGDSEIHYGSFKYKVIDRPVSGLEGNYWTDRNTKGSVRFSGRKRKYYDSFKLAQEALG